MEEDLNEEELEERFYSMLHHVDDTKTDGTPSDNALNVIKNAPQSTVRRYWRTSASGPRPAPAHLNTPFQKVNVPKEPPKQVKDDKPKAEKCPSPVEPLPTLLSIFHTTSPHNVKKTIEIIEHEDDKAVEIMSSDDDDDEVIEVALPPKPTITIDSSDDEIAAHNTPTKAKPVPEKGAQSREVSASPVPSIVSSVSDDFIRGDCVAFNISRRPEKHSFDFSLHEADLDVGAPAKKKKKKKNKGNANAATFTPISANTTPSKHVGADECFATPKSKAKNKKSKSNLYTVTETSIPSADVYDSDSNQSTLDVQNKNQNPKVITEQNLPSADFASESILLDTRSTNKSKSVQNGDINSSNGSISLAKDVSVNNTRKEVFQGTESVIDLTENVWSNDSIEDNIVIANVTGLTESDDYHNHNQSVKNFSTSESRLGSTKVPDILLENADFDNIKGMSRPSRKRRYSMTTLRNDMQKFYNESWGGEDFNHREIQKNMSRDNSLWVIDMKDKVPMYRRKHNVTCNYCNRVGHRDDVCWQKPPVCHMCGLIGHREPKCPYKICINCGSPNSVFSQLCGACAGWARCVCAHCRQRGHPVTHCAYLWRQFQHTINNPNQLGIPQDQSETPHTIAGQHCAASVSKHSNSTSQETNPIKRRRISSEGTQRNSKAQQGHKEPLMKYQSADDNTEPIDHQRSDARITETQSSPLENTKPQSPTEPKQRKIHSEDPSENTIGDDTVHKVEPYIADTERAAHFIPISSNQKVKANDTANTEKAANFIPISNNFNSKDRVIQDNSVNASNEVFDLTVFDDGLQLLPAWLDFPRDKNTVLRILNKALDALKQDLGDPKHLHRKINRLRNKIQQLLNHEVVDSKQWNNKLHENDINVQKLNLILIGQAGLAGGSFHVQRLNVLKQKLENLQRNTVPNQLRTAISKHYCSVFSNVRRNDYLELLRILDNPEHTNELRKKKRSQTSNRFEAQQCKGIRCAYNRVIRSSEKLVGVAKAKAPGVHLSSKLAKNIQKDISSLKSCMILHPDCSKKLYNIEKQARSLSETKEWLLEPKPERVSFPPKQNEKKPKKIKKGKLKQESVSP